VRGLLEQVSFSKKGHAFLNFGGRYPQHIFTGFVPAQNAERVGGEQFLQSLAGSQITVTGDRALQRPAGDCDLFTSADRSRAIRNRNTAALARR
jgi:hypothetical protein